ncbi:hypothetical protein PTKIN_Ptkin13bG0008600 [Pterospermum kingtungense]
MKGIGDDAATAVVAIAKWKSNFSRTFQYYLDRSTPHLTERWLGTLAIAVIYVLRDIYFGTEGVIGFLSPKVDPELEVLDGASLPTKGSNEFRPFIRRLPKFKFLYSITKAFCMAFLMTFFSVFDVPVFWLIVLFY